MTCDCQEALSQLLLAVGGITESLHELHRKADKIMTQQDQLNADLTTLTAALGDVATQTSNAVGLAQQIQDEIAELKSDNPQLDLSGLDALAASAASTASGLDTAVSQLAALVPAPAAPPADGSAPPADDSGAPAGS